MKTILWLLVLAIVGIVGFMTLNDYIYNEKQGTATSTAATSTTAMSPEIIPIMHASGIIRWDGVTIYMDPTGGAALYAAQPAADIVVVTDIHGDHLSTSTLLAVVASSTTLVVPQAVGDLLPAGLKAQAKVLANGSNLTDREFKITAIPMYNFPESADSRHTKGRGNGYVIEKGDTHVYIAGDTGAIPEMKALTGIDIAFLPMNPPFTMTVEEAAEAVLAFKPAAVYPFHYRGQDGLNDVEKFKQLVNAGDPAINVVLLNWYPQQ